ncbi:MAG: fibronectin type III-like domain-contianing protein, partial [Bacteroidota bacterium]|nr:fibronectin type III-like domain-contianing protein [Bacteroidota bacterium]
DYHMTGRTYRYFKGKPLFPFGYGLSYTTFKYDTPTYQNGELKVRVSNNGKYDGDEVVQVYIKDPRDVKGPLKTLRAFRRIHLKSGESQEVSFPMTQKDFALWDYTTNTMRYQPGKYQVWVGDESLSNVTPE